MAQWLMFLGTMQGFVNWTWLPLLYRNSRAVALAQPDFIAGWLIVCGYVCVCMCVCV